MQPSSDQPNEGGGGGGSALRRFGPIAAIVVVIAVIAAVVITSGGEDDDTADTATDTPPANEAERPEGAISFSQAEADGLDVTFPDTCDEERGTIAIPFFFAPECYANVEGDNGGATSPGVTADKITVVLYNAPDVDPVLDFITGPINNDDTAAQVAETVQGYVDLFNAMYQTYGREVELKVLNATGTSTDEVAARADAKTAVEELGAFAVLGGPVLTPAWTEEIAAQGVICIECNAASQEFLEESAPYVYTIGAGGQQTNVHAAEYVNKKLNGKPAEFAGDEAFKTQERKFGHVYIQSSEQSDTNAAQFKDLLSEGGTELTEQLSYRLDDLARLPEQVASIISKLKSSGVTTVLLQADPVAPKNLTDEALKQEFFPEWAVVGGALVDTNVFGRVFNQEQWAHAFGITEGAVRTAPELDPGAFLYEWFTGELPPAIDSAPVLYPAPALFFAGLQAAGPNLTPETFRDGLFSGEPTRNAITAPSLSYGDHGLWDFIEEDWNGIDDATEWWWDVNAEGPDEISTEGKGLMRFVDGGKRFFPGDWGTDLKLFDPAGTATILEEPPAEETPPDYPSPAG